MPLYLLIILVFIVDYGLLEALGLREIILCTALFLAIAGGVTAMAAKQYEKEKRSITASVAEYKKKIGGELK